MQVIAYRALAEKVLVVAVRRQIGWCAYCDAVAGENHEQEFQAIVYDGCKLLENVARAIFPQFSNITYEE